MYISGIICGIVSLSVNIVNLLLICLSFFGWVILNPPPGQAGGGFVPTSIMNWILVLAIMGIILAFISFKNARTLFWKVLICIGGVFHIVFLGLTFIAKTFTL